LNGRLWAPKVILAEPGLRGGTLLHLSSIPLLGKNRQEYPPLLNIRGRLSAAADSGASRDSRLAALINRPGGAQGLVFVYNLIQQERFWALKPGGPDNPWEANFAR